MRDNEDKVVDIFFIIAAIVIVILKLTNVITISWLWLLSPLWIMAGLGFIVCIIITIMFIIHSIRYDIKEKKENERY